MYVWFMYVCLRHTYIHAQTYTLKHTRLRPSNIHTYTIEEFKHTYTIEEFKHTCIHTRLSDSDIHTYMLEGFSKVPPLTQDQKSEQECSRRAFSKGFLNPKLFCEIRHTFIHAWGLQTYTLEAFKHTRLMACLKSMTGRGFLNIHTRSRASWKAFR